MYETSDLTGGTTMYNETTEATNLTGGTAMYNETTSGTTNLTGNTTTKNGSVYVTAAKIGAFTGLGAGLVGIGLDLAYRAFLKWRAKKEAEKLETASASEDKK